MSQLSKNEFADIPDDDPWKNDVLERKAVADYLTPVVASINQPFVVSLHSPYGTGKSYFLEAWKKDLDGQGYHTALFNAWETDFTQDPLSAFMSSIKKQLVKEETGPVSEKFKKLVKGASSFFRKQAAPLLAQAVLRKAVGDELAKDIKKDFAIDEDDLAGLAGALATEAFKGQEQAEQSMADFKLGLAEVVESLVVDEENSDKKKIIIFVDELDRCRPTYALEILECIKHFFAVPGLVFVLAIDDEQVRSSIRSIYGSEFNAEGYLHRFIDWRFNIPQPDRAKYIDFLFRKFGIEEIEAKYPGGIFDVGLLSNSFCSFSRMEGLSLREIERCVTELFLVFRSGEANVIKNAEVTAAMCVLRVRQSAEMKAVFVEGADPKQLLAKISNKIAALVQIDSRFLFETSDRLNQALEAWFLDGQKRRLLDTRIVTLTSQINAAMTDGKDEGVISEWNIELSHLKQLQEWHIHYRRAGAGGNVGGSVAQAVFAALETGSKFLD